jgi:anti-sigma factor RsiW
MTVISIDGHPREEELADYVADVLALAEADRLEAHVFECSVCARRLQRAASLQMVLHEAAALEAEVVAPPRPAAARSWLRGRVGTVSALWASAAAVLLLVSQQGGGALELEDDARATPEASAMVGESSEAAPSITGCDPAEPRCANGLLASVDPLQSVDPLSSWPDDPFFASAAWANDAQAEGEPCGSGEDGGPLVCQPSSG